MLYIMVVQCVIEDSKVRIRSGATASGPYFKRCLHFGTSGLRDVQVSAVQRSCVSSPHGPILTYRYLTIVQPTKTNASVVAEAIRILSVYLWT